MKEKIKVAQLGLGPIGIECIKAAASKQWANVIGAVDTAPDKVGSDLGSLTKSRHLRGLNVVGSTAQLERKPDLVFHTTVSSFRTAYEQIAPLARQGIHVVSSCEELVYPRLDEPKLAAKLDRICRDSGARVVGAGVNPGFVMDMLPLCLTGIVREIRAIHVQRVVDAATRREPLQRKIGSGLAPKEFERLLGSGKAGHAGLKQSLGLIAHALGWTFASVVEIGHAIVAERAIRTRYLQVRKGETCGLHQRVEARIMGQLRLTLDLKMYLDAEAPRDAIQIEGNPPLDLVIRGGVSGDQATIAALVNIVPRLLKAEPGLRLLTELVAV
jgi:4-hydroxy-tetrahydrodipicolinate reductase